MPLCAPSLSLFSLPHSVPKKIWKRRRFENIIVSKSREIDRDNHWKIDRDREIATTKTLKWEPSPQSDTNVHLIVPLKHHLILPNRDNQTRPRRTTNSTHLGLSLSLPRRPCFLYCPPKKNVLTSCSKLREEETFLKKRSPRCKLQSHINIANCKSPQSCKLHHGHNHS